MDLFPGTVFLPLFQMHSYLFYPCLLAVIKIYYLEVQFHIGTTFSLVLPKIEENGLGCSFLSPGGIGFRIALRQSDLGFL